MGKNKHKSKPPLGDNQSKKKNKNEREFDWITSLAKNNGSGNILSKDDRKRKREAKKARRLQQKQLLQQPSLKTSELPSAAGNSGISSSSLSYELSKNRLRRLSKKLIFLREDIGKKGSTGGDAGRARPRPYYHPSNENFACCVSKKIKRWNQNSIQPRPSDYNGIGMARNSLYLQFIDPSYNPKLEEEFSEHVPGFFGKQRTKAMKKQRDGNMLWRRLADKQNMSKKLKGMSPDERVKTLIESEMV